MSRPGNCGSRAFSFNLKVLTVKSFAGASGSARMLIHRYSSVILSTGRLFP